MALRMARRLQSNPESEKFSQAVDNLDRAFVKAVGKAKRIAQSYLSEEHQAGLRKAESLFAIAFNTSSTDNEKALGAKAGIKALNGVVPVSPEAIQSIREKSGLLELEA